MHRYFVVGVLLYSLFIVGCAPKSTTLPDTSDMQSYLEKSSHNATTPVDADAFPDAVEVVSEETLPTDSDVAADLTEAEKQVLEKEESTVFTVDDQEREGVQTYFSYFTHRTRKTFSIWLERAEIYLPYVKNVFAEKGLPEELAYLPFVESGFNPRAYSRAGASGLWQFMPYTGRKFGLHRDWWMDERRDPYKATHAAADYLSTLYEMFGDWYLALAAYNAGEGKIGRALEATGCETFFELTEKNNTLSRRAQLRKETRHYIPKFLAVLKIMRNLEELGFKPLELDSDHQIAAVTVQGGTDLLAMAESIGMSWDDFYGYNYSFRTYISPPDRKVNVYLPVAYHAKAKTFLADAKSRPYKGYHVYSVRSGDSWHRIGQRFGVPVSVLKKVNKKSSNIIHPGQKLMIPGRGSQVASSTPKSSNTKEIAANRSNYVIRSGDTLWSLSRRFGVNVNTLMRANGLSSAKSLRAGQRLYIPDTAAAATKVATSTSGTLKYYTVRKNDTVWSIAQRLGVNHKKLMQWNRLSRNSLIHPGDKLKVYYD